MIRILVADDHAMVRKGLIQLLERQPDMGEFGEAATAREALERVRSAEWHIVVLDIALPDRSGLDVLRDIRELRPQLPVLLLTMYPEDQLALQALRAGATGYLTKDAAPEELVKAIRWILAGHKYLSPTMAQMLADGLGRAEGLPHERLSEREYQVMRRLASGASITQIAADLGVSAKSVTTYRSRLLTKMSMETNAELTAYALQHGLVTEGNLRHRPGVRQEPA